MHQELLVHCRTFINLLSQECSSSKDPHSFDQGVTATQDICSFTSLVISSDTNFTLPQGRQPITGAEKRAMRICFRKEEKLYLTFKMGYAVEELCLRPKRG
uniref:Uncharacterized protein n=1 Tax=Steinernema glaseri TaxID=37863 RepID=A0A1I7YDS8_9BILA